MDLAAVWTQLQLISAYSSWLVRTSKKLQLIAYYVCSPTIDLRLSFEINVHCRNFVNSMQRWLLWTPCNLSVPHFTRWYYLYSIITVQCCVSVCLCVPNIATNYNSQFAMDAVLDTGIVVILVLCFLPSNTYGYHFTIQIPPTERVLLVQL